MAGDSHSTKELIIVGTAALALGTAAGVVFSQRETQSKLRRAKRRIASVLSSWGLISGSNLANGMSSGTSQMP
jgi:hypothetical protein